MISWKLLIELNARITYSKFFTEFLMIIVSWNCRGACGRPFPLRVRELIKRHAVEILILVEPRVSGQKASKIIKRLGFTNWIRVDGVLRWYLLALAQFRVRCRLCLFESSTSSLLSDEEEDKRVGARHWCVWGN